MVVRWQQLPVRQQQQQQQERNARVSDKSAAFGVEQLAKVHAEHSSPLQATEGDVQPHAVTTAAVSHFR
jgi:hypothetical protein